MKSYKAKLLNWVVNNVVKGFDYDEVWNNLNQEQKDKLALKAKEYSTDEFWKGFDKMITNLALNKMGRDSINQDEMMFAKMVLWYHEMRQTKLKEIAGWESKPLPTKEKW